MMKKETRLRPRATRIVRRGASPSTSVATFAAAAATHWGEHMGFFPMQVRWPRITATAEWRESLRAGLLVPAADAGTCEAGTSGHVTAGDAGSTYPYIRATNNGEAKVSDKQVQVSEREIIDQCDLEAMSLSDPRLDALRAARESMLQRSRRRLPALLVTFAIELMVAFVITKARRSLKWSHGDALGGCPLPLTDLCPRRMPLTSR